MARPTQRPTRSASSRNERGPALRKGGQHAPDKRPQDARRDEKKPAEKRATKPGDTYWMYGRHAVEAALANPERKLRQLYVSAGAAEHLPKLPAGLQVIKVEQAQFQKLLGAETVHQGMALEVSALEEKAIEDAITEAGANSLLLVLDQVTDPQNIGAILRSAAAFGADGMVISRDHAPGETGSMAKTACGGLEVVPRIGVTNLSRALEQLKQGGYWVVGLDGTATQALHEHKLSGKVALVLGAEGKGLRRLTLEHCDLLARLPISQRMESLNVSNAAAVALYELARDRLA